LVSPPFEARIDLPWMYGRGVFDMKSVAVAQLLALVDVKKSGRPLARSVLFLATGGEETGSELGARWFIRAHPEMVASFWALLTEGGTVEARTRSEIKYWGTEVAQKHYADLVVCGASRERLEALRETLRQAATETDLTLSPVVREVLRLYGPTRDSAALREALTPPEALLGDIARFRRLPPYLRSMLRNEAVDRRMDAEGRALDLALAAQHLAVIADFHQAARRHLRPMQPERDLVIAVVLARHGEREMVEDPFAEAVRHGHPVRRRQIDPRLPFRCVDRAAAARFHQSHFGSLS